MPLGDRRPTQLLREMKMLADKQCDETVLKPLFMDRLPENVRFVLSGNTEPLQAIAEKADKMLESTSQTTAIHAIQPLPPTDTNNSRTEALLSLIVDHMAALNANMTKLLTQNAELHQSRSRNRSPTPSRYRSGSPAARLSQFLRSSSRPRVEVPQGLDLC